MRQWFDQLAPRVARMDAWGNQGWENLAHQIVLLAIRPQTGRLPNQDTLALVVSGAVLGELALQERVGLVENRVRVHDQRPTEDALLDLMLAKLAAQPPRRPTQILLAGRRRYLHQVLADLVGNGWVVRTTGSGLVGDRFKVVDADQVDRIRAVAADAMRDPVGVSARTACLGGLASQLFWGKDLVPEMKWWPRVLAKTKLENRDWVVKALSMLSTAQRHTGPRH